MSYKQVILVRQDLQLPKGKMSVQVAHAAVEAVLNSDKKIVEEWRAEGMKKSALKVKDDKELLSFLKIAKGEKLKVALINDAGRTFLAPGTVTCLAIGPDEEEKIDKVTGKLKLI